MEKSIITILFVVCCALQLSAQENEKKESEEEEGAKGWTEKTNMK